MIILFKIFIIVVLLMIAAAEGFCIGVLILCNGALDYFFINSTIESETHNRRTKKDPLRKPGTTF